MTEVKDETIVEETTEQETEQTETKPEVKKSAPKKFNLDELKGEILTEEDAADLKTYIKDLRDEAKKTRLSKKEAENQIKNILGLDEDSELNEETIKAYQNKTQQDITNKTDKANDMLIKAEIKNLEGYNSKLVNALLDKSKLTISENGDIEGLKAAMETLEVEYPEIKVQAAAVTVNPQNGSKTAQEDYQDLMEQVRKNPNDNNLLQQLFSAKQKL